MHIAGLLIGLFLTAATFAQSIVTPVFVHKDGDASAAGYTGSDKEIVVDGGSQPSVGWIMFQTQGIDFSKTGSAKLSLYVKSVIKPGTLQVRLLTSSITSPENSLKLSDIPADAAIVTSIALGTADVEKVIQLDLTPVVKAGTIKGVSLTSDDGLSAAFDSREGHLAPVILLTHNLDDAAAKWLNGSGTPANTLGKDGDFYLNTASGDVSSKNLGAWAVVANVVGPAGTAGAKGDKGDKGDQGIQGIQGVAGTAGSQGLKGDKGDQGDPGTPGVNGTDGAQGLKGDPGTNGHSPVTTSTTMFTITSSGNISITLDNNRLAFGRGQRIRIASTAGPSNFMEGTITAYTSATGVATVALDNSGGSGRGISAWTVTVAGTFPSGTAVGDMQYWDGTQWMRIPAGQPGQALAISGSLVPQWTNIPGTVTDYDGNVYRTIVIGNQEWTVTNLRTTHYNDGTAIQNITTNTGWSGLSSGAYCYYNNTTITADQQKYGSLYNWYAVNDSRGLAPAGWRVPTDEDWTALEGYLTANGYNYDGSLTGNNIAKSMAAGIWASSTVTGAVGNNLSLNNKSGFSAIGGGTRGSTGVFSNQGSWGGWWSITEYDASNAWYRYLYASSSSLVRNDALKSSGFSVRLVRDVN